MKLKRRQDQLKEFKTQQAAYGQALQAQQLKEERDRKERERVKTAPAPQHWGDVSGGGGHQAPAFRTAPKSWDVSSGMGPGGKHYAYGGRVGYKTGGRVGILAVF